MGFYDKMQATATNVAVTENGMVGYKTTYHPLVDMNFKLTSYRKRSDAEIAKDLAAVVASTDGAYALKYIFMARDAREGLGERRFFRVCMKYLINEVDFENKDSILADLISKEIVEYGRYDDLFVFMDTAYEDVMIKAVLAQLKADFENLSANKSISLLAKWMPSENASSKETKRLASKFRKAFGASPKEYRKVLSALRAKLKIVEADMSAKNFSSIDYSAVPSKANLKYANAFLRNDEVRRRDYLAALRLGATVDGKKVKINSGVNFPHDVVHKYTASSGWYTHLNPYDEALEQLWKALKDKEGLADTIVVRDGSGSMTSSIDGGKTSALEVSTALAIYCAERLKGEFNNKFITFSARAKLIDLTNKVSLHDKIATCYHEDECSNTNIQNVFELILRTAVDHNMSVEEMPKQVLIISDMEFDSPYGGNYFNADANVFSLMAKKYKNAGYDLPKLVFWNVCSRSNTIPCKYNKDGVLLVSGFSVNVLNQVLNGTTDPFDSLTKELDSARYEAIPLLVFGKSKSNVKKTKAVKTAQTLKPSWL